MDSHRRVWQHEIEDKSESQLTDAFNSVHIVIERLRHDYGEDLFARPFLNGNPTGNDFFIQLKGTDNIDQYLLESRNEISYQIELANLVQWHSFTIPVILIVWDVKKKFGYWVHIQPLISEKLEREPAWLTKNSGAKKLSRTIRIPTSQIVTENNFGSLMFVVDKEWDAIKQGKKQFELQYKVNNELEDKTINPNLSISIKRQLKIIELQSVVEEKPNEYEGWLDLAATHYDSNNKPEALKAINKAWDLAPKNRGVIQTRACILAEFAIMNGGISSMLHEAIKLFKSTRVSVIDAVTDYNIGNCYAGLKDHKQAIKYFDKSLTENPSAQLAAQIFTNRGNELDDIGKSEEAIQSFKDAIKKDPNLWNAHASWGALSVRRHNYKEACKHFREAFRCNPELTRSNYDVAYWFAYSLAQIGELKEALSVTKQILSENPLNKHALDLKAFLLGKLRHTDKNYALEALSFFTVLLVDDPSNMVARSELNQIYLDQGLKEERRKLVEETVSLENAPTQALYDYAIILTDEGRIDAAMAFLESVVKKDQSHLIVHTLARLKREKGQYREAITYYKLALKDGHESLSILNNIANCYHFLDEYEKSVKVLALALLMNPRQAQIWNNLGFALNKLKFYEMSLICTLTIKEFQQHADTDEKFLKKALKELLHQMEIHYGKDYVLAIKEAKGQRSFSEL